MGSNVTFRSKIGLIAATVGSAVGLGNIWRFPAETQANGGAAFLLIYILCVAVLGIPLMLGEFAIGRAAGSDPISDYKRLSPGSRWWMIGITGILAAYVILCFYTVVAGWTLEYLVDSVSGSLYAASAAGGAESYKVIMEQNITSDLKPVIFSIILILANGAILLGGVQKGIERISNLMMPLLFLLLLVFCVASLTMPGAGAGMKFFLTPDFSKVTAATVINAMGQAFFSLSLGMGVLMTYAAYFPKDTRLGKTSVIVAGCDMLVAIMMGVIIFPAIMTFGLEGETFEGASLVFVTMPEIFAHMPMPQLWSSLFFLLLLVAALTSTISISEVAVRFLQDRFSMSRRKAVIFVMLPLFLLSPICSLSNGSLSDIKLFGLTIFGLMDFFATNILLPLGALLMALYYIFAAPKGLLRNELNNDRLIKAPYAALVEMLIKWVAPVLILIIFVCTFIKF